jgi:hypothetical protein
LKKTKSLFKVIDVHPYSVRLWLLITNNPSLECTRLNLKYKNLGAEWDEGAAAVTHLDFYNNSCLLVVIDGNVPLCLNTICHEVVHIKNRVNDHAGIEHDPDNDEPEAYLSGWIAEQIEKAWKEYKKM